MTKPGLLTLTIKDKSALYLAYMPYVVNGGLFILHNPTPPRCWHTPTYYCSLLDGNCHII